MARTNKFGLARDIPANVAREVRMRCGFGCVICGKMICDYHHIEEFTEVDKHDPEKIVLLCKEHHADVTGSENGRRISDDRLKIFIDNPYSRRYGNNTWFNFTEFKAVKLGKFLFFDTRIILRIDGHDVLSFCEIRHDFPFFGINALFTDLTGKVILTIKENLVSGETDVWDFTQEGNSIQINSAPKKYRFTDYFPQ